MIGKIGIQIDDALAIAKAIDLAYQSSSSIELMSSRGERVRLKVDGVTTYFDDGRLKDKRIEILIEVDEWPSA